MSLPNPLLLDTDAAAIRLAHHLREGELALIIGAGASRGVGLPLWSELVQECVKRGGIPSRAVDSSTPNSDLRSLMEEIEQSRTGDEYRSLVREALYAGVEYTDAIIRERLLIAFGALLMGSRRGKIRVVINFNFDDVLEWYLGLHGFETQVVPKLPALIRETDVVIYHPHGFLPKERDSGSASQFLVLSQYSYDERLGSDRDPWLAFTKDTLLGKVGLFVGLSGDDPTLGPTLVDVKRRIGSDRPTGFWLFGPTDCDLGEFERRNIVPVRLGNYDEIASFLLRVCQIASRAAL